MENQDTGSPTLEAAPASGAADAGTGGGFLDEPSVSFGPPADSEPTAADVAVQAGSVTPDPAPVMADGKPRDDKGRFQKTADSGPPAAPPVEPAPEQAPPVDSAPGQPDPVQEFIRQAFGDKYKTPEDALRGAKELQEHKGRLEREIQEIRQQVQPHAPATPPQEEPPAPKYFHELPEEVQAKEYEGWAMQAGLDPWIEDEKGNRWPHPMTSSVFGLAARLPEIIDQRAERLFEQMAEKHLAPLFQRERVYQGQELIAEVRGRNKVLDQNYDTLAPKVAEIYDKLKAGELHPLDLAAMAVTGSGANQPSPEQTAAVQAEVQKAAQESSQAREAAINTMFAEPGGRGPGGGPGSRSSAITAGIIGAGKGDIFGI